MQPTQTNELPLWPFWDKNHLTGLKIHSRFKNKKYSPFFVSKGQRVNKVEKLLTNTVPKSEGKRKL
jgi:hypothetical protein